MTDVLVRVQVRVLHSDVGDVDESRLQLLASIVAFLVQAWLQKRPALLSAHHGTRRPVRSSWLCEPCCCSFLARACTP